MPNFLFHVLKLLVYFCRKSSVAKVILQPGTGDITINGLNFVDYMQNNPS